MTSLSPANEVWGKVIFLHKFVILFTGGGQSGPGCLVPGRVPAPRGGCLVQGGACSRGALPGGDTPTATAAGGTHPTGMHSCFKYDFETFSILSQTINVILALELIKKTLRLNKIETKPIILFRHP